MADDDGARVGDKEMISHLETTRFHSHAERSRSAAPGNTERRPSREGLEPGVGLERHC